MLDHYPFFYSIIVGLTVILYLKKWGELLQRRQYSLYVTAPILWSIAFLLLLLRPTPALLIHQISPVTLLAYTSIPCCYYLIGMLLFPSLDLLDRNDQFAYLDYYEHFRKQIPFTMSIALVAFFLQGFVQWNTAQSTISSFMLQQHNYLLLGILIFALFSEHKGLMLSLVWILLATLYFFY